MTLTLGPPLHLSSSQFSVCSGGCGRCAQPRAQRRKRIKFWNLKILDFATWSQSEHFSFLPLFLLLFKVIFTWLTYTDDVLGFHRETHLPNLLQICLSLLNSWNQSFFSFQSFLAQRGVIELCSGVLLADASLTKKNDSARPQTVVDVMNHYQYNYCWLALMKTVVRTVGDIYGDGLFHC